MSSVTLIEIPFLDADSAQRRVDDTLNLLSEIYKTDSKISCNAMSMLSSYMKDLTHQLCEYKSSLNQFNKEVKENING